MPTKTRREKTKQEQVEYHLKKLEYRIRRLRDLGLTLDDILPRIDLMPAEVPVEQIAGAVRFWDQPTLWKYMLFAVWRFNIVEDESGDKETIVTYKLGPYRNSYMTVSERSDKQEITAFFLDMLGFSQYGKTKAFNNAMYYEDYKATFPVPLEEMRQVIELLKTRKHEEDCKENREKAREILQRYYNRLV